jgi:hypothetical protein
MQPSDLEMFVTENSVNIQNALNVINLILLFVIVTGGGISGAGTWTAAVFAIIFSFASLGITYLDLRSHLKIRRS